jgi:protein SCO1/2
VRYLQFHHPLLRKGAARRASVAMLLGVLAAGCQSRSACVDCLPRVALTDQHGQRVDFASLKGKTVLLDFIYTSCPGPCATLTDRLSKTAAALGPLLGSRVAFVSITIDPEHDGARQLAEFARAHGADYRGWLFLTGSPRAVDQVLADYRLAREREPSGEMAHIEAVFLLGPDGRVVRRYDGEMVKARRVAADVRQAAAAG